MIEAVAVAADGAVVSVLRAKGVSHVVEQTATGARSLFETADIMRGLWIAPSGAIHAAGKRHHTNASGAWKSGPTGAGTIYAMWGCGDDVFAGSADGDVMRWRSGAWTKLGTVGNTVFGIHGRSGTDIAIVGDNVYAYYNGSAVATHKLPDDAYCLQSVFFTAAGDGWLCATSVLFRCDERGQVRRVTSLSDDGELYGCVAGTAGVVLHRGTALLRLERERFVEIGGIADAAFMLKNASYATCIASNGARIAAGGARSVIVSDGDAFVEWPAFETAPPAKPVAQPSAPRIAKARATAKGSKAPKSRR
jgi:hypothetical protein